MYKNLKQSNRCLFCDLQEYNCKYLPYAKMTNLQNYALTCTTEPVEFFISAVANVGATTKLSSGGNCLVLYKSTDQTIEDNLKIFQAEILHRLPQTIPLINVIENSEQLLYCIKPNIIIFLVNAYSSGTVNESLVNHSSSDYCYAIQTTPVLMWKLINPNVHTERTTATAVN
ncbi:hypothetical protein D917_03539 [Trichinella nativa]|uniref:Uncharacterized protein n=1 Tax=Trichinella nativa TaxID=6335 RepID=A0A1Y3E7Y0_9BILA|nr:hypothetical protein D917_03539 [Trichinella nativa]